MKRRWKINLGLLAIFLSGALVGAAVTGVVIKNRIESRVESFVAADPADRRDVILKGLSRRLDLDEPTRERVGAILAESMAQARATVGEVKPKLQAIKRDAVRRIARELTPEQRRTFRMLVRRHMRGLDELPEAVQDEAEQGG
jgi:uncharacterized membrane protein